MTWDQTCALCGHTGRVEASRTNGDVTEYLCHNEERDCYHLVTVWQVSVWPDRYTTKGELKLLQEYLMPHRFGKGKS